MSHKDGSPQEEGQITNTGEIRPTLASDAVILPRRNGVFCQTDLEIFNITGDQVYVLISLLVPQFTGERAWKEILSSFAADIQPRVTRLFELLCSKGVIQNSTQIPERIPRIFHSQIELIEHLADRAVERFQAFQNCRLLLAGSGIAFRTCAVALIQNGLKDLYLAPDCMSDIAEIHTALMTFLRTYPRSTLTVVSQPGAIAKLAIEEFSFVAYCADAVNLKNVIFLNHQCARTQCSFLPGFTFEERGFVGPLIWPTDPACWLCGIVRLSEELMTEQRWKAFCRVHFPDGVCTEQKFQVDLLIAQELGNSMAFEIFKHLAGNLRLETHSSVLIHLRDEYKQVRTLVVPQALSTCIGICNVFKMPTDIQLE